MNGEAPSNVSRLRELTAERPDAVAYVHLAMDGTESSVTWSDLDRRSSQLAAALSSRGVGYGDRVGLGRLERTVECERAGRLLGPRVGNLEVAVEIRDEIDDTFDESPG